MSRIRSTLAAIAVVGMVATGAAVAQTPAPAPAPTATAPASTDKPDFKTMTKQKWAEFVAKFRTERVKWRDCRKQAKDQGLRFRKRWEFLYGCMMG